MPNPNPYEGKNFSDMPRQIKVVARPSDRGGAGVWGAGVATAGIEINHGDERGMVRYALGDVFLCDKETAVNLIAQGRLQWADPNAKVTA